MLKVDQYFKENPNDDAYIAVLDVQGNAKVFIPFFCTALVLNIVVQTLQTVAMQAKKLGKSLYILSADTQGGKVAHVNAVSPQAKSRGLDAREWANAVVQIVGGKVRRKMLFISHRLD